MKKWLLRFTLGLLCFGLFAWTGTVYAAHYVDNGDGTVRDNWTAPHLAAGR